MSPFWEVLLLMKLIMKCYPSLEVPMKLIVNPFGEINRRRITLFNCTDMYQSFYHYFTPKFVCSYVKFKGESASTLLSVHFVSSKGLQWETYIYYFPTVCPSRGFDQYSTSFSCALRKRKSDLSGKALRLPQTKNPFVEGVQFVVSLHAWRNC